MNKFILVLFSFALISCEADVESIIYKKFQRFIHKYNKNYSSINEYLARFNVFRQNLIQLASNGPQSFETGVTKFSDLTRQEFAKTYLNLNFNANALINLKPVKPKISNQAPDAFDWRDKGVVSGVKDQGTCGSCWSFSTVSNLEGLYAQKKGEIKTFSEQYLIDCDTEDSGCNGGLMELTFDWLSINGGGIMYEADYPYANKKGICKQDSSKFVDMKVTGYVKLGDSSDTFSPIDEDYIKEFLYETGPLAIALNADALQFYSGGILDVDGWICDPSGINHAVNLVGYGVDTKDYWIVRNSWGKNWGEDGYFRIARGKATCGVNYYITSATVEF